MTQPKVVEGSEVNFGAGSSTPDALAAAGSTPPSPSLALTGLEAVSEAAIQHYVEGLELSNLTPEQGLYRAYAFTVKFDNGEVIYSPLKQMKGHDAIEVVRQIGGQHYATLLPLLSLGTDLGAVIEFPHQFFPEQQVLVSEGSQQRPSGPYFELLKFPPRARTFYAGVLEHALQKGKVFERGLRRLRDNDRKTIDLQVSTRDILDYAVSIKMADVATYLKILGEKK